MQPAWQAACVWPSFVVSPPSGGAPKLRAFLRGGIDFDGALTVGEYSLEVNPARNPVRL